MAIKYLGNSSTGQSFDIDETRTILVEDESLDKASGYEGDTVVYTATVRDETFAVLPATFVVDLKINSTNLIAGQLLSAAVYDQVHALLTLSWVVPATAGSFSVTLEWTEQTI